MMVTRDPLAASYCNRILFIKDGVIYNEIYKGDNRIQFYQEIMDVLSLLGALNNEFYNIWNKQCKKKYKVLIGYFLSILIYSGLLFSFNMFISHPKLDTTGFYD